jgi:hypothetical protein
MVSCNLMPSLALTQQLLYVLYVPMYVPMHAYVTLSFLCTANGLSVRDGLSYLLTLLLLLVPVLLQMM